MMLSIEVVKTPVVGGELRYSVHAQVTNTDDNGDEEMGADEPNKNDDGGKNENDSGTCPNIKVSWCGR